MSLSRKVLPLIVSAPLPVARIPPHRLVRTMLLVNLEIRLIVHPYTGLRVLSAISQWSIHGPAYVICTAPLAPLPPAKSTLQYCSTLPPV